MRSTLYSDSTISIQPRQLKGFYHLTFRKKSRFNGTQKVVANLVAAAVFPGEILVKSHLLYQLS